MRTVKVSEGSHQTTDLLLECVKAAAAAANARLKEFMSKPISLMVKISK